MLFVDLDKLKIIKTYNYQTFTTLVNDIDMQHGTIKSIKDAVQIATQEWWETQPALEAAYTIIIDGEGEASEEEAENFLVVVNTIVAQFFQDFIKMGVGRPRERRLDVPEKIKPLKMNLSTLKRAVNFKTHTDQFNLIIKYKDLVYMLVDEKEMTIDA